MLSADVEAVGAVRELDALLGLGINSKGGNRYGWRR